MRALAQNPFRNIALALGISFILSAGATILLVWIESGGGFADVSSLWRWSLQYWSSAFVDDEGGTIKIVHEPFATFRNLSAGLFGLLGAIAVVAWLIGRKSLEIEGRVRLGSTASELEGELSGIIRQLRSHLDKNKKYSSFLREGHVALAAATTSDQIKKSILLLISENQRMLNDAEEYERSLASSRSQVAHLRVALAQTLQQTVRDALTSCFNRRYFDAALIKELKEAGQNATPVSLIIADIDHFKSINDRHGHPIGDEVLKQFADLLRNSVAKQDIVARYGGEEFAVILPKTNLVEATRVAGKMKGWLDNHQWLVRGSVKISKITASFGVSQWRPGETPAQLVKRADVNLYSSKSLGRNRVTADPDSVSKRKTAAG
jgi:diguanylate cyclase